MLTWSSHFAFPGSAWLQSELRLSLPFLCPHLFLITQVPTMETEWKSAVSFTQDSYSWNARGEILRLILYIFWINSFEVKKVLTTILQPYLILLVGKFSKLGHYSSGLVGQHEVVIWIIIHFEPKLICFLNHKNHNGLDICFQGAKNCLQKPPLLSRLNSTHFLDHKQTQQTKQTKA